MQVDNSLFPRAFEPVYQKYPNQYFVSHLIMEKYYNLKFHTILDNDETKMTSVCKVWALALIIPMQSFKSKQNVH